MPIEVATKQDVREAVIEAITPLLQKIEELEEKTKSTLDLYKVLSREEVADIISVSPESVDRLARENKINYVIINNRRKYRVIDVLNFLKQNEKNG